jgi:YQGE family putative transporter
MKSLVAFLQEEKKKYDQLSQAGKILLVSFFFFVMSQPLLGVFVQTYFWRQTHDPLKLALYYCGFFAFLPFGFALNGKLLAFFSSARLYWFGCILQGLVPFLIIFFKATDFSQILFFGSLYGFAGGFFWANRNFLTIKATTTHDRLYYSSLESFTGTIISIIVPVLTGWLLILGEKTGLYLTDGAYRGMSVLGFLLIFLSGFVLQKITIQTEPLKTLFLKPQRKRWQYLRLLDIFHGFYNGIETSLPIAILLLLAGNEATLGTTQSISELLSAFVIYGIGSFLRKKYHLTLLAAWVICVLLASALLAIFFTPLVALLYFAILAFTSDFRWVALITVIYDTIDEEEHHTGESHYLYLLDREFFLNVGRLCGLAVFVALYLLSSDFALRTTLLIGACLQIVVYLLAKHLIQTSAEQPIHSS